jgi:carbohydrate ABC transporter ATP-binding protein, CUT1 family (TC 3.A.1.1.-)
MIAGLESISSGELRIGGRIVNDVDPKDRDIAMVFQSYALYPHKTVRETSLFRCSWPALIKPKIAARVEAAARTSN